MRAQSFHAALFYSTPHYYTRDLSLLHTHNSKNKNLQRSKLRNPQIEKRITTEPILLNKIGRKSEVVLKEKTFHGGSEYNKPFMIGRLPKNELEFDKKKIDIFARNEEKSK